MHVSDVGAAVIDVLRHDGPLHSVYNLEGFKARASEIVADIREIRPGARITLEPAEPPILFPLICGTRLRAEVGFDPRYDRRGFVQAMLS
jgi:nucleoside-diphosphate-sugar epimerase